MPRPVRRPQPDPAPGRCARRDRAAAAGPGQTRTCALAADEFDWDDAPAGQNQIAGQPLFTVTG